MNASATEFVRPLYNVASKPKSFLGDRLTVGQRVLLCSERVHLDNPAEKTPSNPAICTTTLRPAVHFVGFRDDRYWNAAAVWGLPDFIHRWWDLRARREIAEGDVIVFAEGAADQAPRPFNAPDWIEERE